MLYRKTFLTVQFYNNGKLKKHKLFYTVVSYALTPLRHSFLPNGVLLRLHRLPIPALKNSRTKNVRKNFALHNLSHQKTPKPTAEIFFLRSDGKCSQTFLHTATQDFLQQKTACFSRRFVVEVLLQPYCRAKSPQISRLGRQWQQPCLCPFRRSRCKHPGRVFRPALHARWLGIFP